MNSLTGDNNTNSSIANSINNNNDDDDDNNAISLPKRIKNDDENDENDDFLSDKIKKFLNETGLFNSKLQLSSMKINDKMMNSLCKWIINNVNKTDIGLGNNLISSKGAIILFDALNKRNDKLLIKSIDLTNNNIDDKCMLSLGEFLKGSKSIENVFLSGSQYVQTAKITDKGIQILAPYLFDNTKLKKLDISHNKKITKKSLPILTEIIEKSSIEQLLVEGNMIDFENIALDTQFIRFLRNKSSDQINFHLREINDKCAIKISEMLKEYGFDHLKVLSLQCSKLTSIGALTILNTLKSSKSLQIKCLNFNSNKIDGRCMGVLGEFIKNSPTIEIVSLSNNGITNSDIELLIPFLIGHKTLKSFNISYNKGVSNRVVPLLVDLANNSIIEDINVFYTSISFIDEILALLIESKLKKGDDKVRISNVNFNDKNFEKVCNAIKTYGCKTLKEIVLDRVDVTENSIKKLFGDLKDCNNIVSNILIYDCNVNDKCLQILGEFIQDSKSIISVTLSSTGYKNYISDKGIEILAPYLANSESLEALSFKKQNNITDKSAPLFMEIIMKSNITKLDLSFTSISLPQILAIGNTLTIPTEKRETKISSLSKSAAKSS